jgi:hypothetical protein
MKTLKSSLITVLTAAGVVIMPAVIATPGATPAILVQEEDEAKMISGIVKERTEKELILRDNLDAERETKFRLTEKTKYVKGGQPATAEDVAVGSRVVVKAKALFLGRYEAVEVTLLPTPEPEPAPGPEPPPPPAD